MSFLFATEVELGYDSKVTLYRDGDVDQYTYEMPQQDVPSGLQFYRTIKPIAEYLTNSITGRMCRIWLVAAVNSPTDPNPIGEVKKCILKDVWPETKAQTELQLQSLIFKDIEDAFSEIEDSRKEADAGSLHAEDAQFVKDAWEVDANTKALRNKLAQLVKNKGYKKFFLIPVSDFVGECSKATIPGAKRTAGLFITRSTAGTSRPLPSQTSKGHVHRDYIPREQYRIVFDEVCTTVGNLETLGEVVQVLRGTLIPLQLLFCARWVHRDISSGNIMAYREASGTWQAKLSDLEYAKKYPPDGKASGDPKTVRPAGYSIFISL
ncbi:hypothetical protein HYPSUDRAFT_213473 [Hypholoma sublateritium FD-334 SS-4]|uniref:Fungal-type protein kinase domain-containing protein n=1 Tax=Hypholoma sublateritium (strain FD-334 SS-4) TaxID=945553 RepID=A0A0D2P4X1_HYPSF|nr:hypothetical protein HYPSUDRAFT_213473 [Hypholoma sublateritium FD-334 SS-4]